MKNGLLNVCTIIPNNVHIADAKFNVDEILNKIDIAMKEKEKTGKLDLILFPELSISGYTCGDLFHQNILISETLNQIERLEIKLSKKEDLPLVIVGAPIRKDNKLFNTAVVFSSNGIEGIIPKTYIPNYNEFYEGRYFTSSKNRNSDYIHLFGRDILFTPNILFNLLENDELYSNINLSVEICEDLWVPIPPSSKHSLNGANVICNLSGSNEIIGKKTYREQLIKMHSATTCSSYIYASCGMSESTTDTVFSGHTVVAENGSIIFSNDVLEDEEFFYNTVDVEKSMNDRTKLSSYVNYEEKEDYYTVPIHINNTQKENFTYRKFNLEPFIPKDIKKRADEIIKIQAAGLSTRLRKIGLKKVVLGVSGGLDSTLALLVIVEAFKMNNWDMKGIIGITMPCFGTTKRTKNNSVQLMDEFGITAFDIDISEVCDLHFRDLNHDKELLDITYENIQARERTSILMNMANKQGAMVVGTGDLSELALGWCTYNADQMSMYGVNASIPKTLVRHLVKSLSDRYGSNIEKILLDICDTPVSPELLPPNEDGTIKQKTEDSIGLYSIHDFTMYYMLRYGYSPSKIFYMYYSSLDEINKTLEMKNKILDNMDIFYKRFFTQQFKRSVMPDGIKVGSISLSPRADFKMPSDANYSLWLNELKKLRE